MEVGQINNINIVNNQNLIPFIDFNERDFLIL